MMLNMFSCTDLPSVQEDLVSSLVKCLVMSFACFQIGLFFYCWVLKKCSYILVISPLSDMWLANIFLPVDCLPFHLLTEFFTEQKFLIFFKLKYRWYRSRQWHPTPVLLPGKSHGRRSLIGCSPWGREESDTTERLLFYFSLSCIGEGNGNPLQCSCLENPRDGGAWWAAIYGVAQSRTRLKWLSSIGDIQYYICYAVAAAAAKSLQSCLILCDPIDSSPPGSSIHGIFQARVLEWGCYCLLRIYAIGVQYSDSQF